MTSETMRAGQIRAGMGGWTFEPWDTAFYPDKLAKAKQLAYAARQVPTIEVNGTYYSSFKEPTFAKWAAEAPDGFAVYSDGNDRLLAPVGWSCQGRVGADGGRTLAAWPPDSSDPTDGGGAGTDAVVISVDYSAGAIDGICGLLPASASQAVVECTPVPADEQVVHSSDTKALFEDPPGVSGSGFPSGGADPANGVVINDSNSDGTIVSRATCTLPESQHASCTTILRYWLSNRST